MPRVFVLDRSWLISPSDVTRNGGGLWRGGNLPHGGGGEDGENDEDAVFHGRGGIGGVIVFCFTKSSAPLTGETVLNVESLGATNI